MKANSIVDLATDGEGKSLTDIPNQPNTCLIFLNDCCRGGQPPSNWQAYTTTYFPEIPPGQITGIQVEFGKTDAANLMENILGVFKSWLGLF